MEEIPKHFSTGMPFALEKKELSTLTDVLSSITIKSLSLKFPSARR